MKKVKSFTLHPLESYLKERSEYLHALIEEQNEVVWEEFETHVPEMRELLQQYGEDDLLFDAVHKTLGFLFSRLASLLLLSNYETQRQIMQSMETEGEEQ